MDKLFTWFDVETVIRSYMYEGSWHNGVVGITVFSDEVEIRIKDEKDKTDVFQALTKWFGLKFSKEEEKIYLESNSGGEKRFLSLQFEMDPEGKQLIPENLKPNFATFSLYPETPNLKGPDLSQLGESPSIWAFYSFKGGVGRTLHLISLIKALSEQEPAKRVLIVDADLEAPGLTWWAEKEYGKRVQNPVHP